MNPTDENAPLPAADERYRALVLASPLVVWRTTPEGEFFDDEPGWHQFTGQTAEEARGVGWLGQVHPDDVEALHAVWMNAAQTEQAFETRYSLHRFDGQYRRVAVRGVPVRHEGIVTEWIGTLADVEDGLRAGEQLREGDERLRFALSVSGTGVWDWNVETGELEWNDGQQQLFGQDAETPRLLSEFLSHIHDDDAQGITAQIRAALQTDDVAEMEYRLVRCDGEIIWVRAMGRVFARDERGEATRMMGVISDITPQKEAEIILRRSHEELQSEAQTAREELADLRRRLLARLVEAQEEERLRLSRELHDQMGQSLTVVAMNLRQLSEFVCDALGDLPAQHVDLKAELDRRFAALQGELGELGEKVGSLARELRPPSLDTLGLPSALQQLVNEWARATGIGAQFDVLGLENRGARFAPEIEVALYRVVQEALTNVARHSGARTVSVLLQQPLGELMAIVEDDGHGFVADEATGNRLGLVGMRERLHLVGGSLQIESEPGRRTTLFARVPLVSGDFALDKNGL